MDEHNRGILFRSGPGTFVRNIAGQTVYESQQQAPSSAAFSEIKPLTMSIANSDEAPGIRVKYGEVGGWSADEDMDMLEDGSEDHPYFYLTEGLLTNYAIYVTLTVSYDGAFWRIDSVAIEAGESTPAPSTTKAYFTLGSIVIEDDQVTRIAQTNYGNPFWVRAGNTFYYQDLFVPGA